MSDSLMYLAQQLQQAYTTRMQGTRPNFSLRNSEWVDARKWLKLAATVQDVGISPERAIDLAFGLVSEEAPPAWRVCAMAQSDMFIASCRRSTQDGTGDMKAYVEEIVKWALTQFNNVARPDGMWSSAFLSALVSSPISVQPWLRVLIGYRYHEVIRKHLPEALAYFERNPDIAKACLELGFPPQIINPQLCDQRDR